MQRFNLRFKNVNQIFSKYYFRDNESQTIYTSDTWEIKTKNIEEK